MANLRFTFVSVINSSNITATFSSPLNEDIGVSNITITSQTSGVSDPKVLSVSVVGNSINIVTQPLIPFAAYFILFISTQTQLFNSLNGDAVILNDGVTNRQLIQGPQESNNPILQYLTNFLRENVYNLEPQTIISSYLQGLSAVLSKSLYSIHQSGNENYLSFMVSDEIQTRGTGPFDRLNQESAYEVLRVGLTPTGTNLNNTTVIQSFPNYPVSLQSTNNIDILTSGSQDIKDKFNINTFTLNLDKRFVIILNSVTFVYSSSSYNYDISKYGYKILDSTFDPNSAFTYLKLSDSQIMLNDKILNDITFSTDGIVSINVNYQYKDTGKIIDATSLVVDTVISSGREVLSPIENIFALNHAPVVTTNDIIGKVGDIEFIDPNALPGSNTPHPAFVYEIPFRLDYLPSRSGEYSVDYNTGNVYVFGASSSRDGSGPFPPLAVYNYRHVFRSEIDYVFDSDLMEIVGLPFGSLINSDANIIYNYEQVLAQEIDYTADVHIEELNENIQNRLVAINAIQPLNFPVTDVFRIFNQTTGEIYSILRFTDNKIYFNYVKAPNIATVVGERVSFQDVLNEVLFVNTVIPDSGNNIYKILLNNNHIISSTQDCIGSSINSSASFSNINIFKQEIYFDLSISESINNSRLQNVGDYQIDYSNGIVWCLVPTSQNFAIGTISYKRGYIATQNSNILTVDNIYYRLSVLTEIVKTFQYISFSPDNILPASFDISDEKFFMGNSTEPYIIVGGQVGELINAIFTPGVTNVVKFVRGLFEYEDLANNRSPINFASTTVSNGFNISVAPLVFNEYHSVQFDGTNYYVLANTNLLYQSPNITTTISVIRLSDNAQLWNGSGTVVFGTPFRLTLPGIGSPAIGDAVLLTYTYTINNGVNIVVDYNKGDYFVDYTYLADEIIISYEYGDNVLDFSKTSAISPGDQYFVSYKVGALRDALLANFGTLINLPILNSLDVSFPRENYRDALMGAMQSFTTGPTVVSMSNLVNTIVKTKPQIIESAFSNWSLGSSLLNPEPITTQGSFSLVPAKYNNGVVMDTPGQIIKFPTVSNLRLEQGSLEAWVMPEWNGIDNEAELNITITKDGYALTSESIFIGPTAFHPTLDSKNSFEIDTHQKVLGIPNKSKDGVFIYYTLDQGGRFNRWYLEIIDGYFDGYTARNYNIKIKTNGKFYDVKSMSNPQPTTDKIFSGTNDLTYTITSSSFVDNGITFIADNPHYLFDFGKQKDNNRFSIYKDESGYINFRVIDSKKNVYIVSSDVSAWRSGQQHHIAVSWALSTKNARDEMHLFIDGFEVPNIIVYGSRVTPYLHEKFRTINPEEIVGKISNAIVAGTDLITTINSQIVSSSINFTAYGIVVGGIIYIEEPGFDLAGYQILNVNGQTLTLNLSMPATSTGSMFSVNKQSFDLNTPVNLYPNIAVSLMHADGYGTDLQTTSGNSVVSSASTNFTNIGVLPGSIISFNEPGFAQTYTILVVNNHSLTLNDSMPVSLSGIVFYLYSGIEQEIPGVRALRPAYTVDHNSLENISTSIPDGYEEGLLTIRDLAQPNDIVLIKTLGINIKLVEKEYYLWNSVISPAPPPVNTIMTRLPPPALLEDVRIVHVLLDGYLIGPNNCTLAGGIFTSGHIFTDQPSLSDNGRTLSVNVSGTNIDFTTPITVSINGTINGVPNQTYILTFTGNGELTTISSKFSVVNYIVVSCKPIDPTLNCIVISVREFYPITTAENSTIFPIIRYSYQTFAGNTLIGSGNNVVNDVNGFFSSETIGSILVINSPSSVAGQYQITAVSEDHKSATISNSLTSFTDGVYQVLNTTTFRSGLQNGFFTFEQADGYAGVPYNLVQGLYRFEYYSYLSIPLDVDKLYGYVGSDVNGNNLFDGVIDDFQTISEKLTDTRIGETVAVNQETITKDFNSLKALKPTVNSLMLLNFDTFPFTNSANIYTTADRDFIQSSFAVNGNFSKSVCIKDKPIIIDNAGILDSKKQGTIEFWVSPLFDTSNDPNYRYYFDATAMTSENVISINNATVSISGRAAKILNVKVQVGDQSTDYFSGGKIDPNQQTIYLKRALPNQQTPVIVNYIPTGTNGDRISIYKDPFGYINFDLTASSIDYQVRAPAFWVKGTWHRIKAQYVFNSGLGSDQIKFFVDGYERANILLGDNFIFGQGQTFGLSTFGPNNIQQNIVFKDTINEFFIGSDYTGSNGAYALIDNLRISNLSRPLFMPFGESIDVNYSTNLDIVFPVTTDLYTTLLLDFDSLVELQTNFATLKNRRIGLFDFSINIFDSFDIVSGSPTVKQVLEELIDALKPATSRAFIKYLK